MGSLGLGFSQFGVPCRLELRHQSLDLGPDALQRQRLTRPAQVLAARPTFLPGAKTPGAQTAAIRRGALAQGPPHDGYIHTAIDGLDACVTACAFDAEPLVG